MSLRKPPCAHPNCPDPEKPSPAFKLLPDPLPANREVRLGATAVCKRGGCRRYFLMQPPKQKPGRKKQVFDGGSRIPVGAAVLDRAPYEIETVDEVWGVRCAAAPPRARAARH